MQNASIRHRGFTLVEVIIVIIVIGILAGITVISYGNWHYHTDDSVVKSDVTQASSGLSSYMNFHNSYPPNLAGINFAPSAGVALTLYTNAPSIGVYSNLTADQNAQLFLNTCNANLNGLYNTACTFAGHGGGAKIHVKGTNSTNTMWPSPLNQSDISLPYGSTYTDAINTIISQFQAQGGTFPVSISGSSTALPTPTQQPNGPASNYCLEGRSGDFPALIYHASAGKGDPIVGACPADPDLHYYP